MLGSEQVCFSSCNSISTRDADCVDHARTCSGLLIRTVKRGRNSVAQIAEERIRLLYDMAKGTFKTNPALSRRYVELARRIGMRSRVRIPGELKYITCHNCLSLLIPGVTCRVRIRPDRGTDVVMTCLACNSVKRYPASRERMKRKDIKRRRTNAHL